MCLFRTGKDTAPPNILYERQFGRINCYLASFLQGYNRFMHTDRYGGYDSLDIIHVGYMALLKREFHEIVTALSNGKKAGSVVEGKAY